MQHNLHPGVSQHHLGGLTVLPGVTLGGSEGAHDSKGNGQCEEQCSGGSHDSKCDGDLMNLSGKY